MSSVKQLQIKEKIYKTIIKKNFFISFLLLWFYNYKLPIVVYMNYKDS